MYLASETLGSVVFYGQSSSITGTSCEETDQRLAPGPAAALRALVAEECLCVCESNSLRLGVEPDLFVVVRDLLSGDVKPSVREVLPLAEALVSSDGQRFDPAPESFSVEAGRWTWPRPASATVRTVPIPAGGRFDNLNTVDEYDRWVPGGDDEVPRVSRREQSGRGTLIL